jgi:hypothetical protein
MRFRSLALAAVIVAAPAPALANPLPGPAGAESAPESPVNGPVEPTAPAAPAAPSPEPVPEPVASETPGDSGSLTPPVAEQGPPVRQNPQVGAPFVEDPLKQHPWSPQTGPEPRHDGTVPSATRTQPTEPVTGQPAEAEVPAVTTQSTATQPITGTLVPASTVFPVVHESPISGVHHYAAKSRVPMGTVTVLPAPKRGTVTVVPAKDSGSSILQGVGVSAVIVLGAVLWASRRRADA